MTSIWERYFLKEMSKVFLLWLIGFYALYVLIDYSNHASSFKHYHFSFLQIAKYYGLEFFMHVDVLVPFAILIACMRTLFSLNVHNELVALMASGVNLQRLMLPFLAFGLLFTSVLYLSEEVLQPLSAKFNTQMDRSRAKAKQKKYAPIQVYTLEDGSTVVFQGYDAVKHALHDAYWLRSLDDIYRMAYLYPSEGIPRGEQVEHFTRNAEGMLLSGPALAEMSMTGMLFNQQMLKEQTITYEQLPLSFLYDRLPDKEKKFSEKEARLETSFHYKLAIPWLCLLAVIAPAPFCVRFNRTLPVFFIYAVNIFGLVSFYLVMNAATILGERQMVSPSMAIWLPFAGFAGLFAWRFLRM